MVVVGLRHMDLHPSHFPQKCWIEIQLFRHKIDRQNILGYALYFGEGQNSDKKWDVNKPIPYTFAEDLEDEEIELVKKGLKMITDAAPCITFKHDPEADSSGKHYIYYYRMENAKGVCGASPVGKTPDSVNKIHLNFGDFGCPDEKMPGIAAHEDTQINEAIERSISKYGVPYEYDSIMHQDSNLGSKSFRQATMVPLTGRAKNTKKMGQRKYLSKGDKELLNKMYCWTRFWALNGRCKNENEKKSMEEKCGLSCGYCGGTKHY
ncbi:hypothetical protein WR25_19149 [Diploscapter pachys]|uniref:Peptidase M12A domain-containing protein n=1 Tax=Diploscapter pachys TaxID=2018661 RepID=A0A2A2L0Z3_9BILA|nr:hypothetical protein WR25_19149 [Diploscapter pachys]